MHCRVNPNLGSDNENTMTYFLLNNEEKVDGWYENPPTSAPPPNKKFAVKTFPLLMSLLSEQPIEMSFLA